MRALRVALAVAVLGTATVTGLSVSGSSTSEQEIPRAELARVRNATAKYHDLDQATADGYELLDACFEDEANDAGMGYHYWKGQDDYLLDPLAPEALVYEPTDHGLELVAVEYIVPISVGEPPMVLGQHMHQPPGLPFYVLHAWIWKPNPNGMFDDYNPNVNLCG